MNLYAKLFSITHQIPPLFFILLLLLNTTLAQEINRPDTLTDPQQVFSVMSWNIQNLGGSKDDEELGVMVDIMKDYDLVMIQEVVAKDPAGAKSVAKIADELNRKGAKWGYKISMPTRSPSSYISERYAFLWKTSALKLVGDAFLDDELKDVCDREPYMARFTIPQSQDTFLVINFHARRFDQKPDKEIRYFSNYPARFGNMPILIGGDFNLDESHRVWKPLTRQGIIPVILDTPTTLKRACNRRGEYFNHSIDNIYFQSNAIKKEVSGRVDFVRDCTLLEAARKISDHVPVYAYFSMLPKVD